MLLADHLNDCYATDRSYHTYTYGYINACNHYCHDNSFMHDTAIDSERKNFSWIALG